LEVYIICDLQTYHEEKRTCRDSNGNTRTCRKTITDEANYFKFKIFDIRWKDFISLEQKPLNIDFSDFLKHIPYEYSDWYNKIKYSLVILFNTIVRI